KTNFKLLDLGSFQVKDINNQGQAVGYSYVAGGGWHVFLYSSGTTTDLGTLTGAFSQVGSINGGGVIAGWGDTLGQNREHAFTYYNGTVTPINVLDASYSCANDINDAGQVVGKADFAGGQTLAFRYKDGTVTTLSTLGGQWSVATSINDKEQIAGYSLDASGNQHVFLWEAGSISDLGAMGGALCYPQSINENAQIVGYTYASGYASGNGFLYDHGHLTQLGTLDPGDKFSRANSINDLGQVVGDSFAALTSPGHAFLFEAGSMTDLNSMIAPNSGWVLTSACSINDNGHIVGNGRFNGLDRAYLLTPTPEPNTLTLLTIAGITSLVFGARRKWLTSRKAL
ncbi:MAG TPA: hypothetical protein DD670_19185, partial [Planctomycetaceae bacterium]|nr:hypothetical protein [Planctomycetaceae bacterium]